MLLLNHKLSAAEAYQFGFVAHVYKKSELDTVLWPKLREQSKLSKGSLGVNKQLMIQNQLDILDKTCNQELEQLSKRYESIEFLEAVATFMNRKSKL